MTSAKLEASAKAPCTSTTVGVSLVVMRGPHWGLVRGLRITGGCRPQARNARARGLFRRRTACGRPAHRAPGPGAGSGAGPPVRPAAALSDDSGCSQRQPAGGGRA
nr:hypothetical protein KitaXyl93_12920 [Kitasatospora sp. Xyl93]